MARYFKTSGATANWNDTANWSSTDGGTTGASVPTSADNVFFTASSFTQACNVTVNAAANMADLTISGLAYAMTLTNSTYNFSIYGSMTLPATNLTVSFSGTGYLYFRATTIGKTITVGTSTNRGYNRVLFDGIGGEWTNQDDFNVESANTLYMVNGSWNTNGKTIRVYNISKSIGSFTLSLGNSSLYCNRWLYSTTIAGFTFNCGTSTISHSGTENTFYGYGLTYYIVGLGTTSYTIYGANTFYRLTAPSNGYNYALDADQIITGSLNLSGANGTTLRTLIYSSVLSTPRTITCNGTISVSNCDFRDITFAGSAAKDFSALEIGDCGGNSGATFRTGENRYWYSNTGNFSDAKWYSQTNGGGVAKGMPLPQDTAVFDANSFSTTGTITINVPRIGGIDMSGVGQSVTLTLSNAIECYGNYILGNNITQSGNYTFNLLGRSIHSLNLYNKSIYQFNINSINGTYINNNSFTTTAGLIITKGTFYINDYNITSFTFIIENDTAAILYMGNGTITLTRSDNYTWWLKGTNPTIYSQGSTIKMLLNADSAGAYFYGQGKTYNNLWFASGNDTRWLLFMQSCTINNLKIDPGKTVKFTAGTTTTFNSLTAAGTSIAPITITSATAATHTLNCVGGPVQCQYLNVSHSTANAGKLYAGTTSTNGGNNTGWIFSDLVQNKIVLSGGRIIKKGYREISSSKSAASVIADGNTVAWYASDDLTTITKDVSDFVSRWNDKLGSGRDLLQATPTKQPKWYVNDGVLFDGINDFMKTPSFPLQQPTFIYIVVKQITWTFADVILDGYSAFNSMLQQANSKPEIVAYAGGAYPPNNNLTPGLFGIIRVLFNKEFSKLIVNNTPPVVSNFGTSNANGITLGATGGTASGFSNIQVKEVILRNVADNALDEEAIYNYLATKYSLPKILHNEAEQFLYVTGITDSTISSAIRTLVADLKAYGLWDKMKAIYPFVGGTAETHKWNLKDPRDLDAAFRLVFNGNIQSATTGIKIISGSAYLNTCLIPQDNLIFSSNHVSFYSRTNNLLNSCYSLGSSDNLATTGNEISLLAGYSTGKAYVSIDGNYNCSVSISDSSGFFCGGINTTNIQVLYRNGNPIVSQASGGNSLTNRPIYLLAVNGGGTAQYYENKECAFASIGSGLSDTEANNFYTAVQAFQTTLNRAVAP